MTFLTFRVIFTAVLIALAAGPLGFWVGHELKLVDVPGSAPHKLHQAPMPLVGGIIILVTLLATSLIQGMLISPAIWPLVLPAMIVFLFGIWDDVRGISATWKLTGQVLAVLLLIILGTQVRLFSQQWLNWGITVIWMVGVTNAYNFVDSMDGLATGLAGLAAAFFMLVTFDADQMELSLLSAALMGACAGFYFYTAAPARSFLGDSGAQMLGFLLAALAIAYNPVGFLRLQSWFIPILLTGVPIFDTTLVVVSRFRRRQPIYRSGRDHLYHRLVALGLDSNRAVLTMHLAALLLGCLAFIALELPPLVANWVFAMVLASGVGVMYYLDSKKRWS